MPPLLACGSAKILQDFASLPALRPQPAESPTPNIPGGRNSRRGGGQGSGGALTPPASRPYRDSVEGTGCLHEKQREACVHHAPVGPTVSATAFPGRTLAVGQRGGCQVPIGIILKVLALPPSEVVRVLGGRIAPETAFTQDAPEHSWLQS